MKPADQQPESVRVVFFGNERIATGLSSNTPVLSWLVDAGYDVVAVVVNHEPTMSRNLRQLEVAQIAAKHNIPILGPKRLMDIVDTLKGYTPDVGVLLAYGRFVPQSIIDLFPRGIVNIHPSLLPLHRGPTPIESTILDGDTVTGVSIMHLARDMDAGPVFAQSSLKLTGNETKQELADTLLTLGLDLLKKVLPKVIANDAPATVQDSEHATYDSLLSKEDGRIDWTKPAARLEREVRAFAGWPRSTTTIGSVSLVITKVQVANRTIDPGEVLIDTNRLFVGCGSGSLEILSSIPAGKAEMPTASLLNGYKHRLLEKI